VDIVETGTTLKENGLVVLHDVAQSSARLVVNPASWRFKEDTVRKIVEKVSETL
jgi:ATP phosphoribosyltransferase regulatory subunit